MWEGLFQPMHIMIVLAIAVFAFGPKKLPELGKGLGEGIRALKSGLREAQAQSPAALEESKDDGQAKK